MKKRVLICLLVLLMVLPAIASCNKNNTATPSTTTTNNTVGDDGLRYDQNGYLMDDLPDDVKYGYRPVYIYAWKNVDNEFDPGENASDIVSYDLFRRNCAVEDRFEVSLEFNQVACDYNSQGAWVTNVENMLMGGVDELDLCAGYSMTMMTLAMNGSLADLGKCNYIDFSKPWYPETLMEQLNINDHIYGVSGDISLSFYGSLWFILMSDEIFEKYQLTGSPLEDVRDGSWTIDRMLEYAKDVYGDLNANGRDTGDEYGLVVNTVGIDEFISGSKMTFISAKENGDFDVGSDLASPTRGYDLIEKLSNALNVMEGGVYNDDSAEFESLILSGRGLFVTTTINKLGRMRAAGLDFPYTILPSPKYDEYQANYSTNLGFTYSMWMIPNTGKDTDLPALIIEGLSSEGYRTVIPTFYDEKVKLRFAENQDNLEMFELIRNTAWFEQSRLMYKVLEERSMNPISTFRNSVIKDTSTWTSKIAGIRQKLAYYLRDNVSEAYRN